MSAADHHRFVVGPEHDGERLDRLLAAVVPGLSRRRSRLIIELGGVFVNRKRTKVASRPVRAGQHIEVVIGGAVERATQKTGKQARERDAAALPDYTVVFEDEHLVVVDKPAGLLTAPTPESDRGNLAADLERTRGEIYVVHRLDMPTSGVLVFARSSVANQALAEKFRVHDIDRAYLAVVEGAWPDSVTTIERPVQGKAARTDIEVVERFADRWTLIRAVLSTGRNHQIRRHVSSHGHPVAGDRRYGAKTRAPRLALHAERLGFEHPVSQERLDFRSPLPVELDAWLAELR